MKLLLINQFFWPDSAATSQLLTDLARELSACGHDVEVICSGGSYATQDQADQPDVRIHRTRALAFRRGLLGRVLSYGSFLGTAIWRGWRMERPDVVLTLTTPPLLSVLGTFLKAVRGPRHFIWEMDVYPDVAVDLGYLPEGGVLTRLIGAVADFSRRRADGILVLGECMRQRLQRRGLPPERLHIAENWADGRLFASLQPHCQPGPLRLLYSGNLGLAHDVDTLREAMRALKTSDFQFVFAGGGARRAELEAWCAAENLANVHFYAYRQRQSLGESLSEGDIGVVTQKPECTGSVVPSKVYGLLAAGRPVLFIGPKEATPAHIIEHYGCGWQVDCGDALRLTALLRELAADRSLIVAAGQRARAAFEAHYDLPQGVGRICQVLGAVSASPTSPVSAIPSPIRSLEIA